MQGLFFCGRSSALVLAGAPQSVAVGGAKTKNLLVK